MVQNWSTNLTIRVISNPPFCFVWNARASNPGFPFEAPVLQSETCLIPDPQKAHLIWCAPLPWNLKSLAHRRMWKSNHPTAWIEHDSAFGNHIGEALLGKQEKGCRVGTDDCPAGRVRHISATPQLPWNGSRRRHATAATDIFRENFSALSNTSSQNTDFPEPRTPYS
jgi:hypothetical protein